MKGFKCILGIVCLLVCTMAQAAKTAPADSLEANEYDGITISLLTCGPGEEVYTLYGHTAIRICDTTRHADIVVNYGMFSFRQNFFVARFILGLTDYMIGITSFSNFVDEYTYEGRWVYEQVLNLRREEKKAIIAAIDENSKPENATYRYNCFYNNCTTRARDILTENISGKVGYAPETWDAPSFRDMCHSKTADHRWSSFGNDLVLGVKADLKTDRSEQQFLPENLMRDFSEATITDSNGETRKMVREERYIISRDMAAGIRPQTADGFQSITPRMCACLIAIIIIGVTIYEARRRKAFWILDAATLVATGLAGVVLFLMIFSQHPTVSLNFQILILNPISLIALYPMIKLERKGKIHWWHKGQTACLALGIAAGLVQHYAEGVLILALSLLIRNTVILMRNKKQ